MRSRSVTAGLLPDFLDDAVVAARPASGAPLVDLLRRARVEATGPAGDPVFGIDLCPPGPLYARVRERR
ncbi:hypothetical protein AB0B30_02680 [Streptomyces narbonensis]|uniref:SAM-dependent methyltransferase n=1 Tax=Streptomyces narbonensis TaxID=67333 RepID=A0ABV3C1J5_9ACTN